MFRAVDEHTILGWSAGLTGLLLLASAGLAAGLAADHMTRLGVICGASPPHCGWCDAAVGLGLSGLAAFTVALRAIPASAPARLPGRRD